MDVRFERYFNGVSDCSYCCVDPDFDEGMVEKNLLLWGKAYPFDLESFEKIADSLPPPGTVGQGFARTDRTRPY